MNQPIDPYRTPDFNAKTYCDEQIRELLDKRLESFQEEVHDGVKKLLKEPRQVSENLLYMNAWKYVVILAGVVAVVVLIGVIQSRNADVQLEHAKTERIAHEEAKAMWDHMNVVVTQAASDGGRP